MSESKALLFSVLVAVAGALIVIAATGGLIEAPHETAASGSSRESVSPAVAVEHPRSVEVAVETVLTRAIERSAPEEGSPLVSRSQSSSSGEVVVAVTDQRTPFGSLIPPKATQPSTPTAPVPTPDPIDRSGTFFALPIAGEISAIDFYNGFTYPIAGAGPIKVDGGAGVGSPEPDNSRPGRSIIASLSVDEVLYGDVNGDGDNDAVVRLSVTRDGRVRNEIWVFTQSGNLLELWGRTPVGEVVQRVAIEQGLITVDTAGDTSFHPVTDQNRLALFPYQSLDQRWVNEVMRQDRGLRVNLADASDGPPTVWGIDGVLAADVNALNDEASPNQFMFDLDVASLAQADVVLGHGAFLRITDRVTGWTLGDVNPGRDLALQPGKYQADMLFRDGGSTQATVQLRIARRDALNLPSWSAKATPWPGVGGTSEAAGMSLTPEFRSSDGHNLRVVNELVAEAGAQLREAHLGGKAGCPNAETHQNLSFIVDSLAADLVSLTLFDSGRGCEGYRHQAHPLVIDIRAGRVLTRTETISDPAGQLAILLAEQAGNYGYTEVTDPQVAQVQFGAAGLTIHGTFDSDYGIQEISPTYPYAQVAGLVDPAIADRADAGVADVIREGCGC